MIYTPHILQRRLTEPQFNDSFGRPLNGDPSVIWESVCRCRCDDNGDRELRGQDGKLYRPAYKVVCEGDAPGVRCGDYVRCVSGDYDKIKGEGYVKNDTRLNCLPFTQLFLSEN